MCVGVTLWFGWGGVVSVYRLQPAYGYHTTTSKPQRNTNTSLHTDTTPPQPNHNVAPTHIEPEQYNP